MLWISLQSVLREDMVLSKRDYEECLEHTELSERIRKTLYYGITPGTDRPSLPVTEIAVDFLQDAAPKTLGRVDSYIVSSIGKKASVSPCSLMLGMLYIERLKHRNPDYLQQVSSSDLFLIAMMVASKYLYDEGIEEEVFNEEWAESAKMDVEELNDLERTFLAAIDWNLFVKPEDFWKMLGSVEQRIALDKGLERGYFTYTDLDVVSQDGRLFQIIKEVARNLGKVVLVFSVAYFAGTITLVGAPLALTFTKTGLPLCGTLRTWSMSHSSQPHLETSDAQLNHGPQSDIEPNPDLLSDIQSHSGPQPDGQLRFESHADIRLNSRPLSYIEPPFGPLSDIQHYPLPESDNSLLLWTLSLLLPNSRPRAQHIKIKDKPDLHTKTNANGLCRHDNVLTNWLSQTDPWDRHGRHNSMALHKQDHIHLPPIHVKDQQMDLASGISEKVTLPICQGHSCCWLQSSLETELRDIAVDIDCQNLTQKSASPVNCLGKTLSWTKFQGSCGSTRMLTVEKHWQRNGPCCRSVCDNCCSCSDLGLNYQVDQAYRLLDGNSPMYSGFADLAVRLGIGGQASTAMAG